jgi:hypothetical protein
MSVIGIDKLRQEAARFSRHPRLVENAQEGQANGARQLRAHEDVLRDREARGEREILVDRGDAALQRIMRRGEAHGLTAHAHRARARLLRSGDDLDQARLAGAVVAADGHDLAGMDVEIDLAHGDDRSIILADPAQ